MSETVTEYAAGDERQYTVEQNLRRACSALGLEVVPVIQQDVARKAEAVIAALASERQRVMALESALQGAIYDLQYIANEGPRSVSDTDRLATSRAAWRTRQRQLADADRPGQRGEGEQS